LEKSDRSSEPKDNDGLFTYFHCFIFLPASLYYIIKLEVNANGKKQNESIKESTNTMLLLHSPEERNGKGDCDKVYWRFKVFQFHPNGRWWEVEIVIIATTTTGLQNFHRQEGQ